ncbi:MAG: MBL fold metallo-hydrolase [Noviherbaspirillum sp.]
MKCAIVPVTPFQQNCSILVCEQTGNAALVDPGGDTPRLFAALEQLEARLEKVILTHGHLDHCAAADLVRRRFGVPIEGPHQEDKFWLDQLGEATRRMGFPPSEPFVPDRWLADGDTVSVGAERLEVLHCPGHTPGHVVFFHRAQKLAWVGDVLFQGSIGRTDFPRGDHDALVGAIRGKLWPLGDDVTFVPGHGPTSTFGAERRSNPFVADQRFG